MDKQEISDKELNFPNPKFIAFMKRMWNSEPVSQTEKDAWDSARAGMIIPHAPIIVVDQVAVNLAGNSNQVVFDIELPDLGDDIDISSSSSSSSILVSNSGIFEISGIVKLQNSFLKYDFVFSFFEADVSFISKTQNETQSEPTRSNGSKILADSVIFGNPSLNNHMIVFHLNTDVATNKISLSLRLDTGANPFNDSVHNRIEIRRL